MINKESVMKKYVEMHQLYYHTNKVQTIKQAEAHILKGNYDEASKLLNSLPDKEALQEGIYKHLRGKPVYDTLKKVLTGKCHNLYEGVKGLSSLLTHITIELEKGNMEYRTLAEETYAAIGKHLYAK